jgi:hypothetical protein
VSALEQAFAANRISLNDLKPGRYYTTCPQCSATRTDAHQALKCLGVTIESDGSARWGCNHCGWTGSAGKGNGAGQPLTTYEYRDVGGVVRFRKIRNLPGRQPRFWLQQPDGRGGWLKGTAGVDTGILYRADQVAKAIGDGRVICVAEGEKDVDNLWRVGFAATCNAHGASEMGKMPKWTKAHSAQLSGADLIVFIDNDGAGYAHADTVCRLSIGVAKRVRRLDLTDHWPAIPKGGDISDWMPGEGNATEIARLAEIAKDANLVVAVAALQGEFVQFMQRQTDAYFAAAGPAWTDEGLASWINQRHAEMQRCWAADVKILTGAVR